MAVSSSCYGSGLLLSSHWGLTQCTVTWGLCPGRKMWLLLSSLQIHYGAKLSTYPRNAQTHRGRDRTLTRPTTKAGQGLSSTALVHSIHINIDRQLNHLPPLQMVEREVH